MNVNKSKTYLVPLLDTEVNVEYPKLLINSYISDYTISLLYEYSSHTTLTDKGRTGFPVYEEKLINSPNFLDKYDINLDELPCVVYTFLFPNTYYHEYDCFCEGRYSEFSEESKKIILRFLQRNYPTSGSILMNVKQVLYKDESLRKLMSDNLGVELSKSSELSSKPDLNKEVYDQRTSL